MSNAPAPAPAVDSMTVKVNGIVVVVPKTTADPITGKMVPTTMLQACNLAKVEVPHYCYHPKLPVSGNCRMCLVEYGTPALGPDRQPLKNPDGSAVITKSPRPAIACATPASPGMEIYTNTTGVKQMRQGVLESFLINHPLDCPICDQAGECKLQEYSMEYGQAAGRFAEAKVHKPKRVELGPRIMLDAERCILCTRCIRFTRDIVGDDALGIVNRGSYNTISTYPGQPFDNNYTLNTVDLCPVGALTSKDFRFQMRVWFLREAKSLCTSCGTGCNVIIGSREGKIYRYVPRENDAVNGAWMCDAGRLNYKWMGRPDRLAEVRKRGADGKSVTVAWAEAMSELRSLLESAPAGSTAIIASARQTNEELYLLKRLATKLGAMTDSVPRQGEADRMLVSADKNPNSQGAKLVGIAADPMGSALPQIAQAIQEGRVKHLVVFGEDVTKCGIGPDLLRKLSLLVVSDILPNATTEAAHYLLPGCAHAEKRGTFTNTKGRVQRFWKAVEAPGAARPEAETISDLLGESGNDNPENLFKRMVAEVPVLRGLTFSAVGDRGVTISV